MTETKKCANNIFARWNYITKTKPNLNPNPTPLVFLLGLGLVLDFVLVTYTPLGKNIVGTYFGLSCYYLVPT